MANVAATEKPPMTLEQLKATPEFLLLTSAQQTFVLNYVTTNRAVDAAKIAYPKKARDQQYISVVVFKLFDSPRIQSALAKYFGWSEKEQFIRKLQRQVQRLDGLAQVQALALLGKATGALPSDVQLPIVTVGAGTQAPESAHEGRTPADPMSTAKGEIHAEVAPKPTYDPFSEKMFRSLRGKQS